MYSHVENRYVSTCVRLLPSNIFEFCMQKDPSATVKKSVLGALLIGGVVGVSLLNAKDTDAPALPNTTENESALNTEEIPSPTPSSSAPDTSNPDVTVSGEESVDIATPTLPTYKDGTYSTNVTYRTPGGNENLVVTLTLKNDVITDANVIYSGIAPTSQKYQQQFESGYKTLVIGQDIEGLSLSRVSGSSLTPKAFNNALTQIKTDAAV
jgi:hypothetical protein